MIRKPFSGVISAALFSSLAMSLTAQPSLTHYQKHYGYNWLSHYNTAKQIHDASRARATPGYFNNPTTYDGSSYRESLREEARKRDEATRTIQLSVPSKRSLVLDAVPQPIQGYSSHRFVTKGNKWGIYNGSALVLNIVYDDIYIYDDNAVVVQQKGKIGLLDLNGKTRIPLGRYRNIGYSGKIFLVQTPEGKFGVLGNDLSTKVNPYYAEGNIVYDNILLAGENGYRVLVNAEGKVVLHSTDLAVLSNRLAFANIRGRYFFVNPQTGKEASPTPYDDMSYFYTNGFIWAKREGRYQLLDRSGKAISSHHYDGLWVNKDDSLSYITTQEKKKGLLDLSLEGIVTEMLPPLYDEIYSYDRKNGTAVVRIAGQRETVHMKLPWGARGISPFRGERARVWDGKGYFFVHQSGKKLEGYFDQASLPVYHSELGYYAIVEKDGKKGFWFFNSRNNKLENIMFEDVSELYAGGVAAVKTDGKWGIAQQFRKTRYQGGVFDHAIARNLSATFEAIGLVNKELILVKKNDKWGGLSWPRWQGHQPEEVIAFAYNDIRVLSRRGELSIFYGTRGKSFRAYTKLGKVKLSVDKAYNTRSHYEKAIVINAVR